MATAPLAPTRRRSSREGGTPGPRATSHPAPPDPSAVIPAKAGTHSSARVELEMGPCLRRDDIELVEIITQRQCLARFLPRVIPAPSAPHRIARINPTRREARRTFVGRLPGGGRESSQAPGPGARSLKGAGSRSPLPTRWTMPETPATRGDCRLTKLNPRDAIRLGPVCSLTSPEGHARPVHQCG